MVAAIVVTNGNLDFKVRLQTSGFRRNGWPRRPLAGTAAFTGSSKSDSLSGWASRGSKKADAKGHIRNQKGLTLLKRLLCCFLACPSMGAELN